MRVVRDSVAARGLRTDFESVLSYRLYVAYAQTTVRHMLYKYMQ